MQNFSFAVLLFAFGVHLFAYYISKISHQQTNLRSLQMVDFL